MNRERERRTTRSLLTKRCSDSRRPSIVELEMIHIYISCNRTSHGGNGFFHFDLCFLRAETASSALSEVGLISDEDDD